MRLRAKIGKQLFPERMPGFITAVTTAAMNCGIHLLAVQPGKRRGF
jgi:hypothetical protein